MNYNQIRDTADCERPYEKCLQHGPGILTDAELLAVILRTGCRGKNAVELAREILAKGGSENGLIHLNRMTLPELTEIPGVGSVKAIQMLCICELSRRIARRRAREKLVLNDPGTIAAYYMEDLRLREQECLLLVMLDTRCRLLADRIMTVGTVNGSLVSSREIFMEALRHRAVGILLLHNHPSGDPTPSLEDRLVTEKIQKAGRLLDIRLYDHIVIGDGQYISFKEQGFIAEVPDDYGQ